MNRRLVVLALSLIVLCLVACNRWNSSSIYYRSVPSELTNGIESGLRDISTANPLTPKVREEVRTIVKEINWKGPPSAIREQRRRLRKIGDGAIPLIADLLSSPDAALRSNCHTALRSFIPFRGNTWTKQYADQIAPTLILLCRRSLLDRDLRVREMALGGLESIGSGHPRPLPEGLLTGIEQPLWNLDFKMWARVHDVKVHLGLTAPGPHDGIP